VIQAVQDAEHTVPLIAGKRTYAVATPFLMLPHDPVDNVSAHFTVERGGVSVGPVLAGNPGGRATVLYRDPFITAERTFYYEIPAHLLGPGPLRVCVEVNRDRRYSETNYTNNRACTDVALVSSPPLRVKVHDVRYQQGGTTHQAGSFHADMLVSWLRRAYPAPEVRWRSATLEWTDRNPPAAYGDDGCNKVNELLARQRALDGSPPRWRYYGLVIDTGGFMRGCSGVPGYVASGPTGGSNWGWDFDGSYGDWYGGHELGHAYGRRHATFCGACCSSSICELSSCPYPYPDGIIGGPRSNPHRFFGWDVERRELYSDGWKDVMTYCDRQWISDFTYKAIRDQLVAEEGRRALRRRLDGPARETLFVFGQANLTQGTGELNTLYRLRDIPPGEPPTPSEDWVLALLDAQGRTLARHSFTPKEDSEPAPGEDVKGLISESVPWNEGTARVVLLYRGAIVAEKVVSASAPRVRLLEPNGGESLGGATVVRWVGEDPDGDPLAYALQYSSDNGNSWQTVAVELRTTDFVVDLRELPGSDQALFRVIASDGVHTSDDQSDATFAVARKTPRPLIIDPEEGASFESGQQVDLVGEGYDVEDENLPDSALSWHSDREGRLGEGRHVSVTGLSPGRHNITFEVVDSDGDKATASRIIYVGEQRCVGDCNADQQVTIDELVRMVNIALGLLPPEACLFADTNGDGEVTIEEIVQGVNRALNGC
jgi:hypothetical protein